MFPTFPPLSRLYESTDLATAELPQLVAVLVAVLVLILKDAAGGTTDARSLRLSGGLSIAAIPLFVTFCLIAGVRLAAVLR